MAATHYKNESLAKYSTFKIGGIAKDLYVPDSINDLIEILKTSENKPLLIGYGSNTLFSSNGYDGSIIITKNLDKIHFEDEGMLTVEAGTSSVKLAKCCLEKNLSGLEFLAGIPGSIGGAIIMNSSANGQCISDRLIAVSVFCLQNREVKTYSKDQIEFSYRKCSIDTSKEIIISAGFKLEQDTYENIFSLMQQNSHFRESRQPKGFNVGSIFKNPVSSSFSAGLLLEQTGTKGWVEGGAEVSQLHANFINNVNNATSLDVSRLMLRMHNEVKNQTGLSLRPELRYIGKPTEEEEEIWKILEAQ